MDYHPLDVKVEPDDSDSFDEDEYTCGNLNTEGLEHLIALPDKHGKIRRPPNAFMLFAREHRRLISDTHPLVPNKKISSILGNKWRSLDPEIKGKYYTKAKALDLAHKQQYPNYVYNPKEARERKKSRQLSKKLRKIEGQAKYGKDRLNHTKTNMLVLNYQECANNNSGTSDHANNYYKNNAPLPTYDNSTLPSLPAGYIVPDESPKYPLIGAMEDPPPDHSPDVRLHMMQCLSCPNNSLIEKKISPPKASVNGKPKVLSYMPSEEQHANGTFLSSTAKNISEACGSIHDNSQAPLSIPYMESSEPRSNNSSETNLSYIVPDSVSVNRPTLKHELKMQEPRAKILEHQPQCMRLHCNCSSMMYDGSSYHPPPTPPMPLFYSRTCVNPYMVHPYNIPPLYSVPYIPMNQVPAEAPGIIPNIYSPPNVYHSPAALYSPGYHTYINPDFLPRTPNTHLHAHSSTMPCKMTEPHDHVETFPSNFNTHIPEETNIEDNEDKNEEVDIERPPTATSLNNSSSSLVIVTENVE